MTPLDCMARAMCALSVELDMEDGQSWIKLARVAMQAIREPSEAMLRSPEIRGIEHAATDEWKARVFWESMIDAAMEEV